jgi:hypothetical protein
MLHVMMLPSATFMLIIAVVVLWFSDPVLLSLGFHLFYQFSCRRSPPDPHDAYLAQAHLSTHAHVFLHLRSSCRDLVQGRTKRADEALFLFAPATGARGAVGRVWTSKARRA